MAEILQWTTLSGAIVAALVALACIAPKKKDGIHYVFALLYFSLAVIHVSVWNIEPNLQLRVPQLSEIDLPFACLLGPLVYFIYRAIMDRDFRFKPRHFLHFIPALLCLCLLLPYYLQPAPEKQATLTIALTDFRGTLLQLNMIAMGVMNLAYLFLAGSGTRILWNLKTLKTEPLVRNLLKIILWTALCLTIAAVGLVGHRFTLVYLAMTLTTVGHIHIFIQIHRNPLTFFNLQHAVERVKYRRSLPQNIDIADLKKRIITLLEEQKHYRDPELNLPKMAKLLGVTLHQLSQYLNEHLGKNYIGLLNEYRIEDAKKRLLTDRDLSATAIGYQVGYANYTTFHLVFRKITGLSPKAYRQKNP